MPTLFPFSVVSDSELPAVITICSSDTASNLDATPSGERRTFFQCDVCHMWFNDGSAYEKHKCMASTEGSQDAEQQVAYQQAPGKFKCVFLCEN